MNATVALLAALTDSELENLFVAANRGREAALALVTPNTTEADAAYESACWVAEQYRIERHRRQLAAAASA